MTQKSQERKSRTATARYHRYEMHIFTGEVRYFMVLARNKSHAFALAEAKYDESDGLPGAFLECDHEIVGCFRRDGGER